MNMIVVMDKNDKFVNVILFTKIEYLRDFFERRDPSDQTDYNKAMYDILLGETAKVMDGEYQIKLINPTIFK